MIAFVQSSRDQPAQSLFGRRVADALVEVVVIVGALFNAVTGALSLAMPSLFLALVGQSGTQMSPAVAVFGAYAGARELGIGVALVALRIARRQDMLSGVLVVAALSNAIDAAGAVLAERWVQLPGAVIFAVAYLFAATWIARRARSAEGA